MSDPSAHKRINWGKALKGKQLGNYKRHVSSIVGPLIGHSYSHPDELNAEISSVAEKICSVARQSLPLRKAPVQQK
jgi:hypothetical protein